MDTSITTTGGKVLRGTILFLACLLTATSLTAQTTGKLSGRMSDKATNEPLPGVNLVVKGTNLGAVSDFEGNYFILNLPPGEYDLAASMVGYQGITQRKVIVNANRTTTIDFAMRQITVELGQDVVIIAERPEVQKEKTSTSEIIRSEEVLNVPGIRDLTDMLTLSSDISDGHFRGGREGEELYNLQGMGIVNPLYSSSAFAPIMSAVEEVEVITSGFGAQYGNAQSGVVNISMKEGRGDKWSGRVESRLRLPGYKHFGPSVWDPNANPYLQLLNAPEKWMGDDSLSTSGGKIFGTIGNGFDGRYRKDSVTLSQIAYQLWRLQGRRDYGQAYNNLWDYSLDATVGGPLTADTRLFLALHSDNIWPFLPTPEPNQKRQVMGNLVYDLGSGMNLRFSGAYTNEREFIFRSMRTSGFYYWIWDRILSSSRSNTNNVQAGVRLSHALSASTFYEIKVNMLNTRQIDGAPVIDRSGYAGDWSKTMWGSYGSTPDAFNYGSFDDDFSDERTTTYTLDASITSQVTSAHMLQAGLQLNSFNIDVNNTNSLRSSSGPRFEKYAAKPFELGVFAQDKMEFEGMIANIGLRLDVYNQNVIYYADQYSPFRVYTDTAGHYTYDMTQALKDETPTVAKLQPRIGISFPVGEQTVFHMNYGSFVQRPAFSYTIYQQTPKTGFQYLVLGNPRLQPQITNSYDVGVTQGLGEGFTLDISGYYKDVKNLIQQAFFYDSQQQQYSTFANRDYADIRGFRLGLAKRKGLFTGTINYTYGIATGKNASPFNASPKFYEKPATGQAATQLPSPKDVLLDFDRTHNLVLNAGFTTDDDWGPAVFDFYPLENLSITGTSFIRSGRPYTYDVDRIGALYNHRTPLERNTNLRLSKKINRLIGTSTTLYVEMFNVFDQRIYSYSAVFANARDGSSGTITTNVNVRRYEENPASLQYYENPNHPGYNVDESFMIYENAPRSIQVGVIINL